MKKLVSIVVPTMDRCAMLAEAIESCRRQTYQQLEVLVVDGGTDGTEAYVRGLQDPRIVYVKQPPGQGMMAAFNLGFDRARGDYLTWSSDDDIYFPEAIAVLVDALERDPGVGLVYAHYDKVDAQGKFLSHGRVEDPDWLDRDNCIGHCLLYRREVYEKVGAYEPVPVLAEDYEYWLRVRKQFRMKRIPQLLYHHRMHAESLTLIHGPEKMAEAVEVARRPFVPAWKHHFFAAERLYHVRSVMPALGNILTSLTFRPWHGPSWRLFALLVLPALLIRSIRASRQARRGTPCAG